MIKKLKISLPIRKRIILHLKNYVNYKDAFEVDNTITQEGIAKAINIRLEHVSRSVKRLVDNDYLYFRSTHIKSLNRRKRAYFLTVKGIEYANEIINEIENNLIHIRTLKDEIREIKVNQLKKFIDFQIKPLEIFNYINSSEDNVLDLKQILSYKKGDFKFRTDYSSIISTSKSAFIFSDRVPPVKNFYGRENEKKILLDLLKTDTKIIVIYGLAGIGKTTLVSKIASEFKENTNIFWYDFDAWGSIEQVIEFFADSLNQMGKKKLFSKLKSLKDFELGRIMEILKTELEDVNAVLIFDDFQRCDKHTLKFFNYLKNLCEKLVTLKIIIISRSKLQFYNQRDISIKNIVKEIHLSGLDIKNCKELIKLDVIDKTQLKEIYKFTRGHPVALQFIDSVDEIQHQTSFYSYIEEDIFDKLGSNEKEILEMASVFRYPVDANALFIDEEKINYQTISQLESNFFLLKTPFNIYYMHDMLTEIFYKKLTPKQRKSYHKYAASYYEDKYSDIDIMERIYHLIQINEFQIAAELVGKFGERLISHGYFEFYNILNKLDNRTIPTELWDEILTLKGDALIKFGEWDKALKHYEVELESVRKLNEIEKVARIITKIGDVYEHMGDFEKTIDLLEQSLQIYKDKGNKKEMAKIYNDLGIIHRQLGSYRKSLTMYKKGLKIFEDLDDKIGIVISYLNLGKISEYLGKNRIALNYFNKAIECSEEIEYSYGLAFANKFIGMNYFSKGKLNKVTEYLQKSMLYFDEINDYENSIQLCTQIGKLCCQENRYDEAIELYNNEISILEGNLRENEGLRRLLFFKKSESFIQKPISSDKKDSKRSTWHIDNVKNIMKFYEKIGNIYCEQNKFDNAQTYFSKHLNLATQICDDLEIAKAHINLGINQRKQESFDQTLSHYNNALEILNNINEEIGVLTIHRNIGKIYELKGERKKALSHYKTSLDLANSIQYNVGIEKACRELAKIYFKLGEKKAGDIFIKKAWELSKK